MKKWLILVWLLFPLRAFAHVGSPDVFFEGDAGPYRLFVTVRVPQVIPGIADIEIRSEAADVRDITVVPMRLTGPGSDLPPTPDHADRSSADPKFFTAQLWLMEHGSLQVRITADGARGSGMLSVPVPASAQRTLTMTRGLGLLLFLLMLVLANAVVAIAGAAVREATLPAGEQPTPERTRRARWATVAVGAAVTLVLVLGNLWWNAEARTYRGFVMKPWELKTSLDGCHLQIAELGDWGLLPDHGHDMHLFLVREDGGAIAHLHPTRTGSRFEQDLPDLPAGKYRLFGDVVVGGGFPITGVGQLDIAANGCGAPQGDDASWAGEPSPITWDRPAKLRANEPIKLAFAVPGVTLEPYMGMAGHMAIVSRDGTVFAHIHPSGTVAMPALELAAGGMAGMPGMAMTPAVPNDLAFPYGFPKAGDYRVFVQVKSGGKIITGVFDASVQP